MFSISLCGLHITSSRTTFAPEPHQAYRLKACCKEQLSTHNYILSSGNALIYVHFPDTLSFIPGDSLSITGKIFPVRQRNRLTEFDYNRYLKQKGVYYRLYPEKEPEKTGHHTNLYTYFQSIRQMLLAKTDSLLTDKPVNAIVKALCLGYKNDLDSQTKDLFSSTGTIHLLAVSGLHTGAIFLLILLVLKIFHLDSPRFQLLALPLLWAYACLTGLSPSVIRAANILSFITIGNAFGKDHTPLNAIAASAFFTLLFAPTALYSVSMQMSYAAYTGIVLLYPALNRPGTRFPFLLSKIYSLFAVSLSAQISTFPLLIYYFHSFSINSFLVNIIAVPLATLLLYTSIILLLLPLFIGLKLAFIIHYLCQGLLFVMHQFSSINITWQNLYPTPLYIFLIYLCLLSISAFLLNYGKKTLYAVNSTITALLIYSCFLHFHTSQKKELIVFHQYRQSCILLNYNGHYAFLSGTPDSVTLNKVTPYLLRNRLIPFPETSGIVTKDLQFTKYRLINKNDTIHLLSPYSSPAPGAGINIITGNLFPQIDTSRIWPPSTRIILDGSNHRFNVSAWKKQCRQQNIFIAQTEEHGDITIPLK